MERTSTLSKRRNSNRRAEERERGEKEFFIELKNNLRERVWTAGSVFEEIEGAAG